MSWDPKKHRVFTLILAILIAIALVTLKKLARRDRAENPVTSKVPSLSTGAMNTDSARLDTQPGVNAPGSASISSGDRAAPIPLSFPTLEGYRKEIQENPHKTPASLVRFAEALAEQMQLARTSLPSASRLMDVLEACTRAEKQVLPPAARALCLADAQRLGQTHPELQPRSKALSESAPKEIHKLLEALELD